MPPKKIDPARHSQGIAAYRGGQSIADVIETLRTIDEMHATAKTDEEHEQIASAGPSIAAGYLDGFIDDFRALVGAMTSRRGSRA